MHAGVDGGNINQALFSNMLAMSAASEFSDLHVSIITPQATLLEGVSSKMVVVPGSDGDLGIMARHTPLVTSLKEGEIKVFHDHSELVFSITVSGGGVLSVTEEGVKILMEDFCPISSKAFNVKGSSLMPKQLKIESVECGSYKIDGEVLPLLTPDLREKLSSYVKSRPGVVITKEFVENFLRQRAA